MIRLRKLLMTTALVALLVAPLGCVSPYAFRHPTTGDVQECDLSLGPYYTTLCAQTCMAAGYVRAK
jgi:ABC-type spermidine/putrescine transport system permease subunit II